MRGRGMRFSSSIFGRLLEPLDRRRFQAVVDRHDADAYDKSFRSWDHLVAMIFAQFSGATSLRGVEVAWNANAQHHYHLGSGALARSTLSDANGRRPAAVFAETFAMLAGQLDRRSRREGGDLLRIIDSTPIPLGVAYDWARSNGRIRGMKMHVAYDPGADRPEVLDITHANVNDAQVGRGGHIEPGVTYVFDKGYCHYGWWADIDAAGARFVTRPKTTMRLQVRRRRRLEAAHGDDLTILADQEVTLASRGDSKLNIPLRRIRIKRASGERLILLTNDMERSARDIAHIYKARWNIELLFRWIKQHLRVRAFLGRSQNAVRLQLYTAMIAYALLRIAATNNRVAHPILRYADLVACCLFERRTLAAIEKPPPNNPRRPAAPAPDQMSFHYA